jgi:hypothetical protein
MRAGVLIAVLGLAVLGLAGCDRLFKLDHFPDIKVDAAGDGETLDDGPRDAFQPDVQEPVAPFTLVHVTSDVVSSTSVRIVPLSAPTTVGCLLVVFIGQTSTAAVTVVHANGGDTLTAIGGAVFANSLGQSAYYTANCKASANLMITWDSAATKVDIRILEYANVPTTIGTGTNGFGTSGMPTSPSLATMLPNTLLVAGFYVSGDVTAPGAGYTEELLTTDGNNVEDRLATMTDTYIANVTQSQNGAFVAHLLAFTPP